MANRPFRRDMHKRATTGSFDYASADLRVIGVDVATHDPDTAIAGDEFLVDILAGARVTTSLALQNVTVVDGVVDADDLALPDSGGATIEELVLYNHTGVEGTAALACVIDTASGLPLTPDSVADEVQWDATGIIAF